MEKKPWENPGSVGGQFSSGLHSYCLNINIKYKYKYKVQYFM